MELDIPTFELAVILATPVDSHTNLSDTEKLVYLQQSLREGPGKCVIEGWYCSGINYAKAVECLKSCSGRPRLIHQAHVRMIVEMPGLKDSNGKDMSFARCCTTTSQRPQGYGV